jgi:rhodanese-related sulfurtransferase
MTSAERKQSRLSKILETPPANPDEAHNHFISRLAYETDPSDVYADLKNGIQNIIIIDARSPESYARGHIPRAINLPYNQIDAITTASISKDKVIVTYCAGVHCNASTKAAERLAALGFRVKEMIDGVDGWRKDGLPVEETVLSLTVPASD